MVQKEAISRDTEPHGDEYIVINPDAMRMSKRGIRRVRATATVGKNNFGMTLEQKTMMDNLNKPKPKKVKPKKNPLYEILDGIDIPSSP